MRKGCGEDLHDRIHTATISFPHGSKPGLAAEIPAFTRQLKARELRCSTKTTYHFRVTCPFWTRFMLKPTVGIELEA